MPGRGKTEPEALGHGIGDRIAMTFQLAAGPDGTAELEGEQTRRESLQGFPVPLQGLNPGTDLVGRGERKRLLHPGMRHEAQRAVPALQSIEGVDQGIEAMSENLDHALETQ